jgi:hypothetical protein
MNTISNNSSILQPLFSEIERITRRVVREEVAHLQRDPSEVRYGYGLKSIQDLFGVGYNRAYTLSKTILRDAIEQTCPGGRIRVDLAKAQELYEAASINR